MGTTGRITAVVFAAVMATTTALAREAGRTPAAAGQNAGRPAIAGGHDSKSVWLNAEYRDLRVRKRSDKATKALDIDVQYGGDAVRVSVAAAGVTVGRGSRAILIASPEALADVQQLLGGSSAIFAARALLSALERDTELKAPEMSLLSAVAFVASVAGDTDAPRRAADRFVEKHRGIYRQIGAFRNCWSQYSGESTAAWDELQACMSDADDKGFFRAAWERLACNGVWILRSESAWFEYLSCLSPLGALPQ